MMRLRIDTNEVKFRVTATAQPRKQSRDNPAQKKTPDGRPIWSVGLLAREGDSNHSETIWVEVAGDEPKLTIDELAVVTSLTFAPWVNRKGEIVRSFRADSVTMQAESRRPAAA
jgi:hypothetical protein